MRQKVGGIGKLQQWAHGDFGGYLQCCFTSEAAEHDFASANEQQLLAGSLFAGSTRRLHRCELGTPRIRNARFSRCEWKALGLRPRMSRESRGLVALWQERRCNVVHKPPFLCKLLACTPAFVFENLAFMRSRKCRTVFQRHQILDLKPANLVE